MKQQKGFSVVGYIVIGVLLIIAIPYLWLYFGLSTIGNSSSVFSSASDFFGILIFFIPLFLIFLIALIAYELTKPKRK